MEQLPLKANIEIKNVSRDNNFHSASENTISLQSFGWDWPSEAASSPSTTFSGSRIFQSEPKSFNITGKVHVIIWWEHHCKYDNRKK